MKSCFSIEIEITVGNLIEAVIAQIQNSYGEGGKIPQKNIAIEAGMSQPELSKIANGDTDCGFLKFLDRFEALMKCADKTKHNFIREYLEKME